ncbi:MAG TPA: hypothetical protein VK897_25725 [Anaerolineales bacterium]|nr:hypothetical protein [Anaerolineales bacterium]
MLLSERNINQVTLLHDIYEVSNSCTTRAYIWGGLVQDILTGRFLREHHDVDGFILNLWNFREEIATSYKERGYEVSFIEEVNFLRIDCGEVHAGFNQLEFDGETALWRHAGNEGTVFFPKRWLSDTPQNFYDTKVYISGVELEYAIKAYPRLLNPNWKAREKDEIAIKWLNSVIDERGIVREAILKQVWSYNPYWAKRGFREYQMPCVAWNLEPPG